MRTRLGQLAVDLLGQPALAVAQAVGDLVQRAPPLGRVRLELGRALVDRLLDLPRHLLAHARERGAVVLGVRDEPLGLGGEPRLRVRDQLLLPLLEAGELGGEPLAHALEVLRPGRQLPLDLLLGGDQPAGELGQHALLRADELVAARLGEPAVLLGELGARLRARDRQRPLELGLAVGRLLLDQRVELLLCLDKRLALGLALPHRRLIVGHYRGRGGARGRARADRGRRGGRAGQTRLAAVIPTEPEPGRRVYLCAFETEPRSWLALDAAGQVRRRARARPRRRSRSRPCASSRRSRPAAASSRSSAQQLVALRLTETPEGIEEAEEAALELERTIGAPPRLATPAYLDAIGVAARRLEQALGEIGSSPFAEAMKNATAVIAELEPEVLAGTRRELS